MYTHLSLANRITIFALLGREYSQRQIAAEIGKSVSTVSRECARYKKARCGSYDPEDAHRRYQRRRSRASSVPRKLTPEVRRAACRRIRQTRSVWSAAQFLPVGASALYNWLRREVCRDSHMKPPRPRRRLRMRAPHKYLRHGVLTYGKRAKGKGFAAMRGATPVAQRPAIANARGRLGDVEVDTMHWGGQWSLTMCDRKSRELRVCVLPSMKSPDVAAAVIRLSRGWHVKTITSDGGSEFAGYRLVEKALGAVWYVCDAGCPHQRGGVENMNGVIRGVVRPDIARLGLRASLRQAQRIINNRPTRLLKGNSPAEISKLC